MTVSYRKNYIKIYFWQAISILLGFASLFIVTPYISSNKVLYGIYSLCLSLTAFFSYADLGFGSAASKFAAEYFIREDHVGEVKIISFTSFIMIVGFSIVSLVLAVLAFDPCILIPDLIVGSDNYIFARWMLIILALSFPLIIAQRLLNIIFLIRVEDYKYQRMLIVGNVLRLLSAFYFFTQGRFMLLEYFLFYQFIQVLIVVSLLIYTRRYGYSISEFFHYFRFDRDVFDKVKNLSGTSLILMICMILYYEFDQVVISHLIGIEAVATYGIALTVLGVIRMFQSLVYSPYASRYNHYAGSQDYQGLVGFVNKMIIFIGPILVLPIVNLCFLSEPFIISWVGNSYSDSILLVSVMVLSFTVNAVKDPGGAYLIAMEKNKYLIYANCSIPFIYWIGVLLTCHYWGLMSFSLFKFIAPFLTTLYFWYLLKKDFSSRGYKLIGFIDILRSLIIPSIIAFGVSRLVLPFMILEKGKPELANNLFFIVLSMVISVIIAIPFNPYMRAETIRLINKFGK